MNAKPYLQRIGYHGTPRPTESVLRILHRKHMHAIPFENLDISRRRSIILSKSAFYNKIIKHHRGGFCYELNGSFANLLEDVGFKVSMLSARVAMKNGCYSGEFDHMTLLVQLESPWLVDVGFGDSFTEPKRLNSSKPQSDNGQEYRLSRKGGWIIMSRRTKAENVWKPQYKFTLKPRRLQDFVPRCKWQQTSRRSHFTHGPLCSRLTPTGRLTLTETKFVVTRGAKKVERPVRNPEEFSVLLCQHFGIILDQSVRAEILVL